MYELGTFSSEARAKTACGFANLSHSMYDCGGAHADTALRLGATAPVGLCR